MPPVTPARVPQTPSPPPAPPSRETRLKELKADLALKEKKLQDLPGHISDLEQRRARVLAMAPGPQRTAKLAEVDRQLSHARNKLQALPGRIDALKAEIASLESQPAAGPTPPPGRGHRHHDTYEGGTPPPPGPTGQPDMRLGELRKNIAYQQSLIESLKAQVTHREHELRKQTEARTSVQAKIARLESQSPRTQEDELQLTALKERLAHLDRKIAEGTDSIAKMNDQISQAEAGIARLQKTVDELTHQRPAA